MPKLVDGEPVKRLVSANVDRADGDGHALHGDDRGLVGFELLLLARQLALAIHEEEFAAEQPYAGGARLHRGFGVRGHLDVRVQLDVLAIQRHRRGMT